MVTRNVRRWPDPCLHQMCAPVSSGGVDLAGLIKDLFDTMYAFQGRGLAAPQIGELARVFVVDVTWKEGPADPRVFINPDVVDASGSVAMDEQCLSIPNLLMPVTRPEKITLHWTNADFSTSIAPFDGILARCILHELDHLNGTVIFDHQAPDARAKLEATYAS